MRRRLLFVEDEPTLARAVTRLLRRAGYDVFVAGSAAEAREASGNFSLGVFDVDLPDCDGADLAAELLEKNVVRRIVFFSGTPNDRRRQRATTLGPFVDKAKGFPTLLSTIELLLATETVKVSGTEETLRLGESSLPPPSGFQSAKRTLQ